jgi:lysophospholipase L1-like esterase
MSVEVIDKLKQKNNGTFKIIDLDDVDYDGTGKSAKEALDEKSTTAIDDNSTTATDKTLSVKKIHALVEQCVQKEEGKKLSSNDYTTAEKEKLSALENYDDTEIKSNIQTQKTRIDNLSTLQEGSTTGDAELIDARIDADGNTYSNVGNNIRNNQKKIKDEIKSISYTNLNKDSITNNLLEDTSFTEGYFIHSNGTIQTNKYYSYSDYIDVSDFNVCAFMSLANDTTFNQNCGAFFTDTKEYISGIKILSAEMSNINEREIEIPENCKYIVFNVTNSMKDKCYLKGIGGKKELNWLKVTESNLNDGLALKFKKPWEGKKVTIYGDSLTQINDWKGNTTSWASYLSEYCGFSEVVNKGIGGSTIVPGTIPNKTNDFYTRITTQNDSNTDLFIIFGGMNDYLFNSTLGDSNEVAGNTTLCNTVKSICEHIQTKYPKAQILFILPPYGTPESTTKNSIKTINTLIEDSIEIYGVSVLNLYKDGDINVKNSAYKSLYYYDGVHYNDLGHERIAKNRIIPKINNMIS